LKGGAYRSLAPRSVFLLGCFGKTLCFVPELSFLDRPSWIPVL